MIPFQFAGSTRYKIPLNYIKYHARTVDCRLLCVPYCTVHYITLVAAPLTGTVLTTYTAVAVTLVVMEWLCNSVKLEADESRR